MPIKTVVRLDREESLHAILLGQLLLELRVELPGLDQAGPELANLLHQTGNLALESLVLLATSALFPSAFLVLTASQEGGSSATRVYIKKS